MDTSIKQAIEIVRQGGIIIYPTDTAFGIGCRIDDEQAIGKLFTIRKRPLNQAPPVLFSSIGMVKEYAQDIPEKVEQELMERYWPGALTIILPADRKKVSNLVRSELGIGCRIPAHEIPLSIISSLGVPIIGTSANFAGEPTPYKLADLNPQLLSLVDFVVPGITNEQKESTVIDCTQIPWNVLRQGAISLEN